MSDLDEMNAQAKRGVETLARLREENAELAAALRTAKQELINAGNVLGSRGFIDAADDCRLAAEDAALVLARIGR